MSDLLRELLAAFEIEYREHLTAVRQALGAWEAEGRAFDAREALRRIHSLKGAARAVGREETETAAHRLEERLARVDSGAETLDRALASELHAALDAIERAAGRSDVDEPAVAVGDDQGEAEDGAPDIAPQESETAAPVEPRPSREEEASFVPVATRDVDQLAASVQTLMASLQAGGDDEDALAGAAQRLKSAEARYLAVSRRTAALPDDARRAIGDLLADVRQGARQLAAASARRRRAQWDIAQAALRVRERAEQVSLVKVETVFGGFGRMARDLARQLGRDVDVRMSGLELQAERKTLQGLKEPVMHLVRNAISHGAESPQERELKGKPRQATIGIGFRFDGARLRVEVTDDGPGPDLEAIEAAGLRNGIITAGDKPPVDRLMSLLLEPGFSTSGAVDRLSGRGMGLSIVADDVRRLHGSLILRPRAPSGMRAVISTPRSMARQTLLLVRAGDIVALPVYAVEGLHRERVDSLEHIVGGLALRTRRRGGDAGADPLAPLVSLEGLLTGASGPVDLSGDHVKLVLVRRGQRRCALIVSDFLDVRTFVVGDVLAPSMDHALVSGAVTLAGDAVAAVLSVGGLVERWLRGASVGAAPTLARKPAAAEHRRATILVVDDSITTRTLQKSILESQGYRVIMSVDGLDAISVLRSGEVVIDLIIADVEMPRMDGFSLLRAAKLDPAMAQTPFVLMTSRQDEADIRRGLELGADAYLVKQKFDQGELLATIGQLI